MATIKTKLRPSRGGMWRVVYQIIHRREVKRITSDILISADDWDKANDCPATPCQQLKTDLDHLRRIIDRRDKSGAEYTVSDVARDFDTLKLKSQFFKFVDEEISQKIEQGCRGTAANYRNALRQYQKFRGGVDISVESIDAAEMESFQAWLVGNGLCNNTVSCYMRPLRSSYHRAVAQGLCADSAPFASVYTGTAKTHKRAISEHDIRRVARVALDSTPTLAQTRDLFMLSFYFMGMAFVDLAMLKKTNYVNGRIVYRRQKTGKIIDVKVSDKAKDLIDKLSAAHDSPFLLNIIKDMDGDPHDQYLAAMDTANRRLKKVSKLAGLTCGLTTYTPRHTWASMAKAKNIEISVISDALGHESEATTRIYLATIDTRRIDSANALITKDI